MNSLFCFDQFELDSSSFQLRHRGTLVRVDSVVLRLLELLVRHAGQLVSKEQVFAEVWNGRAVSENAVTVAMARLRKMLEEYGMPRESVVTVHGHGYRFTRRVSNADLEAEGQGAGKVSNAEFVGREQVMLQLEAALAVAQSGRGSVIALRGELGIGKTRVLEMFAQRAARSGCTVDWGCCRELREAAPLWPFVELLRGLRSSAFGAARSNGDVLPPELTPLLPELVASVGEPRAASAQAWPMYELGSKHQVFDAVARTLVDAAKSTPRVLILDDLHCADEASIELLNYLLAGIARTRILFVVALRNVHGNGSETSALSAALNHRNCMRVVLKPLSQSEVARYLVVHFGAVDRALCQKVYDLSEGNPFCMVELVRQLRDGSGLDAAELTVPKLARELVRQRLLAMADDAGDMLAYASVIGRVFGLPLLAAVLGRNPAALMDTLDRACAADILHAVAASGTEFRFASGLMHSAVYDAQSPAERRTRHLRVAQILEQRRAFAEASIAELAHHAWAALPNGDARRAVEYCMQAASAAEQRYACADAIRCLRQARAALDLIEDVNARERFQLLFRLALLVRANSSREFLALAAQLLRMAREQGHEELAAASLLLDPLPGFPPLPLMRDALAEALAALPADAPSLRPALMARLASSVPLVYTAAESHAQIDRALTLAERSSGRVDRFSARFGELYLYGGPAHRARAASALSALRRLCNENEEISPLPLGLLDLHQALIGLQYGDVAASIRALDRLELRCCGAEGELQWHLERLRALVQVNLGNLADGHSALLALHRRAHCCDTNAATALFCAYDQHVVLPSAELVRASNAVLAPDPYDPPNIWALKLRTLEAADALDEARCALALVSAERLRELPCDREFLGTMGALARTALRLREHAYARVIYERLAPFPECYAVNLSGYCEGSVSLLLGLLARSFGDAERASKHFEADAVMSERVRFASNPGAGRGTAPQAMPARPAAHVAAEAQREPLR